MLCSFWLVDNLVLLGRHDDARRLFERLLSVRNDVGLLAEGYDTDRGRQAGNFPQAFSHVGLINSALNLSRGRRSRRSPAGRSSDDGSHSDTPDGHLRRFRRSDLSLPAACARGAVATRPAAPDLRILGVAQEAWNSATFRAADGGAVAARPQRRAARRFPPPIEYATADITNHSEVQRALRGAQHPATRLPGHSPGSLHPGGRCTRSPGQPERESCRRRKAVRNGSLLGARPQRAPASATSRSRRSSGWIISSAIRPCRTSSGCASRTGCSSLSGTPSTSSGWTSSGTRRSPPSGRAAFYDQTGALRDMLQNHLLQLLALVAMEPPHALDAQVFRNRKAEVLSAVTTLTPEEVVRRSRPGPLRCRSHQQRTSGGIRDRGRCRGRAPDRDLRAGDAVDRQLAVGRRAVHVAFRKGARQ